ncbi:AzlC family ABC transporter permease [Pontibaca salina]|uniref:AzlC family ABC transporter permease n=1 Tax=Pontibaca salina TaxID=2795731 RepID=A0A934M027_9RHOB|nr:AzlC family ABC transporter permease [Pontibaca salina]MBI6629308.1 AzlC family ABC transporter permease [Pontibaca salina]
MASTTVNSYFWAGLRAGAPFVVVVAPFGLLFGVLATEAGLNVFESMTFAVTVFAGASQFAALQLMQENAPTIVVLASSLAVNLRMAMYSASLTPYMGKAPLWQRAFAAFFMVDQSYAVSYARFETDPAMTIPDRMAYYAGTCALIAPIWAVATLVGALMGARIPDAFALDFALPITFLAMIAPMLRTPAHVAAALVAVVASIPGSLLPYNLGLLVAGGAGMLVGARTELLLENRKERT